MVINKKNANILKLNIVIREVEEYYSHKKKVINEIEGLETKENLICELDKVVSEPFVEYSSRCNIGKYIVSRNTRCYELEFNKEGQKDLFDSNSSSISNNAIPPLYESQKSNVSCWWCCHQFNTYPIGMPIYIKRDRPKHFRVKGCFCSFNCCLAYINDIGKTTQRKHILKYMFKLLTLKKYNVDLKPAPPREALSMFGGWMNIVQFREKFDTLITYNVNIHPTFYYETTQIQENEINKININYNKRLVNKSSPNNTVIPPSVTEDGKFSTLDDIEKVSDTTCNFEQTNNMDVFKTKQKSHKKGIMHFISKSKRVSQR